MNQIKTDTETERAMLTPAETFKALSISGVHGYRLIRSGKIPAKKYGRAIRVPAAWVNEQVKAGAVGSEQQ